MNEFIDISQELTRGIPVWPGDRAFESFWTATLAETGSVNVGGISMSLHTGTHADAPKHFRDDGLSPADADLSVYVGPAVVADFTAYGESLNGGITPEMLDETVGSEKAQRVLCKTGTAPEGTFPETFAHFTPEAARWLADRGVRLAGIDTPSVDRIDSKKLSAHNVFAEAGIAILENIVLSHASPGHYELIALPLKLVGMDASPVRAVLRRL